jgi:hypothetical protein
MRFQYWQEGLFFIGCFFVMVGLPCLLTAILGTKLIDSLGQWPSRSAKLQLGICIQLLLVEIFAFSMLAVFYRIFSD